VKTFEQNEPLTDAELDRLGDFLVTCEGDKAMNIEELDGFFAALVAGPETVMPSEYYREVFGGEMSEAWEFASLEEANELLGLMMRHWNTIAGTLFAVVGRLSIERVPLIPQAGTFVSVNVGGVPDLPDIASAGLSACARVLVRHYIKRRAQ
jgi:uncharacterized protein